MSSFNPTSGKSLLNSLLSPRPSRPVNTRSTNEEDEEEFAPPPRLSSPVAGRSTNQKKDELIFSMDDLLDVLPSELEEDTFHWVTQEDTRQGSQVPSSKRNPTAASALLMPTGKQAKNPFSLGGKMDGAAADIADLNDPTKRIQALATKVVSSPKVMAPTPQRLETPSTILSAPVLPDHFTSASQIKKKEPLRLHVPGPRRPSAAKQPLQNAFLPSAVQVQAKQLAVQPLKRTDSEEHMEALLDSVLVDILNDPDEIKVNRSSTVQASQEELLKILDIPYRFKVMGPEGMHLVSFSRGTAQQLKTANSVALGDLHGSYRKLVETLITAGWVSMPAKEAQQFAELAVQRINFAQASKGHSAAGVKELSEHVDKLLTLTPAMQWAGDANRKLILIGDVVNDRGTADQITMGIVKHLTKDNPDRIIRIASNHDHYILAFLTHGRNMGPQFTNSSRNAFLIAKAQGEKSVEALKQDYYDYLRQSKLMHYEPGSRTLYTHAPVTQQHMRDLIEYLQNNQTQWDLDTVKNYDDIQTSSDVMRFVEQANQFYQRYIEQVQQLGKLDPDAERVFVGAYEANGFLWSRASLSDEDELPFEGPVQRLVHGHDPDSDMSPFSLAQKNNGGYRVVNLDQEVRKDAQHLTFFSKNFPEQQEYFRQKAWQSGSPDLTPFYEEMQRFVYNQKQNERDYQNLLYVE